jgi:hypothetical protein
MLSYDYSRCAGKTNLLDVFEPLCANCARTDPGHPERQVYIAPAIVCTFVDGIPHSECENHIPRNSTTKD